jgi:histidyl-tRNA synthetase
MELKIEDQSRGTRILCGNEVSNRYEVLNAFIDYIQRVAGFEPIQVPSVEPQHIYINKAGLEILNQMYTFNDKSLRELCLRPEVTATIQLIADKHWKGQEKRVWYFEKCWRYEKPQTGRYREFWQFGVEILNPKQDYKQYLIQIASSLIDFVTEDYKVVESVKRGLSYYTDLGFEIECEKLGTQKQVCGGGSYKNGIGFAIGFDRLMLLYELTRTKRN